MGYSLILPILVTLVGAYFLIRLRAFFLIHPIKTARAVARALKDREARRRLSLALAGTLGVGNIFGVAMGIIIGGEGVVLWIAVSSLFSAVIKYAEALSVSLSDGGFGMAAVIRRVYPRHFRGASGLYSALAVMLAFVMGAGIQSGSVASLASASCSVPPHLTALAFSVAVLLVVLGGAKKIKDATEKIIPLTTLIYIILSFLAIFANIEALPEALSRIFSSALSPTAVVGGTVSGGFLLALSEGYARGILSNEAGAGTSAMAHSGSGGVEAGLFGLCEVFFDTPVLCTLTGLVIVSAIPSPEGYTSAMALVSDAFTGTLGRAAGYLVLICVLLFAYSTVICWYYYGEGSLSSLGLYKFKWLYLFVFVAFIFIGATADSLLLVSACDVILLLMTHLTLMALLFSSKKITLASREAGIINKKSRKAK